MRRRRKRKKNDNQSSENELLNEAPDHSSKKPSLNSSATKPFAESLHLPQKTGPIDRLGEIDDPEQNSTYAINKEFSLPSAEDRKQLRASRIVREGSNLEEPEPSPSKTRSTPLDARAELQKRRSEKSIKASLPIAPNTDELRKLDEDDLMSENSLQPVAVTSPVTVSASIPELETTPTPSSSVPEESDEDPVVHSFRGWLKRTLASLSLLEQASVGLLIITLLVAAFWSTSVVSARIPNTIIASKLRYPLKGESVVVANYESYWRKPIREGASADEGVSSNIQIIPVVELTLAAESKAKALRFLFRNEDGRYVGDSTTVTISGSNYQPAIDVTAVTSGKKAIIRSTTGFEFEGELIAYLADDDFQWEVVILESKDGKTFTEFMAIPISANRREQS